MMTRHRMTNWIGMICAAVVLFGLAQTAVAYTPAYETITNTATVAYKVGDDVPRSASGSVDFVVDNMVDLNVENVDATYKLVSPGQIEAVLTFRVTNEGNAYQDYELGVTHLASSAADPFGGTDNFDATIYTDVNVDNGDDAYNSGDTATFIDELEPDTSILVFVVADIPVSQDVAGSTIDIVNDDISAITLTAITHEGNRVVKAQQGNLGGLTEPISTADPNMTVEVVFADGDLTDSSNIPDGQEAATGAFKVQAALLVVEKTAEVIWDPVNEDSNPKAIPGARIKYSITVTNNGSFDATSVSISDPIPGYCTFFPNSIYLDGVPQANGDAYDGTEGSEKVYLENLSIPVNTSKTLVFQVTIDE